MKQILSTLALASVVTMSCAEAPSAPITLKTDEQKLSYALGNMTGNTFKSHGVKIDPKVFAMGFRNAIEDDKSLLSNKDMNNIVENFQKQDQQQAQKQAISVAKKNLEQGQKFLEENKHKKGVVTTKSGLQFKIIDPGSGEHPNLNDVVVVNYSGSLIDGTEFDSSYKRGQPAMFPVSAVIKGWQEALQLMSPGAKWEVYVPANLAYGDTNYPPMIGPNQTLIFTIELISINKR